MRDSFEITIREWTPDDAEGVLRVHRAAVHETAAASYDAQVLDDWSPAVTADRIARYLSASARHGQATLVAVGDGRVVGFASIVASSNELRAVYVSPSVGRRGVGSRLLIGIEHVARGLALRELRLDASLNAVEFYAAHGYVAEGRAQHVLSTGRRMECVPMRKTL